MEKCSKIAALYVATLKSLALISQHSHWTTRGMTFYGDHLLFERIYNDVLKTLDSAAEKFIGLLGDTCLSYDLQADLLHKVLHKYGSLEGSPVQMLLVAEREFLNFSKAVNKAFIEEDKMTLGLEDMLQEIASKHEEFCYLLQQTIDGE
jgi:DNA-binding ferritin-like protein